MELDVFLDKVNKAIHGSGLIVEGVTIQIKLVTDINDEGKECISVDCYDDDFTEADAVLNLTLK